MFFIQYALVCYAQKRYFNLGYDFLEFYAMYFGAAGFRGIYFFCLQCCEKFKPWTFNFTALCFTRYGKKLNHDLVSKTEKYNTAYLYN
jgi:hypothetical protein